MNATHPIRCIAMLSCLWFVAEPANLASADEPTPKPTVATIRAHFVGDWQRVPNEDDEKVEIAFEVWRKQKSRADGSPIPPDAERLRSRFAADLPARIARWSNRALTEHRFFDASGLAVEATRFNAVKTEPDVVVDKKFRIESVEDRFYLVLRQEKKESWYPVIPAGVEPPPYDKHAQRPFDEKSLAARGVENAYFEQGTQYRLGDADHIRMVILDWGGLPAPRSARTFRRIAEPPEWAAASIQRLRATALAQQAANENADPPRAEGEQANEKIDMKLVLIPAGEFQMGNPHYKTEKKEHEGPPHRVRITKPFYLGRHEVTQAEWKEVMKTNPSDFSSTGKEKHEIDDLDADRLPVDNVTWYDAALFCNALSELEGLKPYYVLENKRIEDSTFLGTTTRYTRYDATIAGGNGYRLPTEAEWEYACRAGTDTRYSFGDACNGRRANVNGKYPNGTDEKGPSREHPLPVESFAANEFGLYDMHGNVAEWCLDEEDWSAYAQRRGVMVDPVVARETIPGSPTAVHVKRGGDWQVGTLAATSYYRNSMSAVSRSKATGFRVARTK